MIPKLSVAIALMAAALVPASAAADVTDTLDGAAPVSGCVADPTHCVTLDVTVVDGLLDLAVVPGSALQCGSANQDAADDAGDGVILVDVSCDPGNLAAFQADAARCIEVGVEVETSGNAGGSASSSCQSMSANCSASSGSGYAAYCYYRVRGSSSGPWHCSLYVRAGSGGHASAKCWVVYG